MSTITKKAGIVARIHHFLPIDFGRVILQSCCGKLKVYNNNQWLGSGWDGVQKTHVYTYRISIRFSVRDFPIVRFR